jgi:hypothetical protein
MFKEALGALSTSLVGAIKDSASEYKPTTQNMGGAFTRIAQQGIANLSFRSPILADMAATMLHNFQTELVGRDTVKQYVASDKSEELRKEVEQNLGKDASKEKIDKEMFKVLDKMRTLVDREGEKATQSSDTFKQYGKFFEKFQKDLNPQSQQPQPSGSTGGGLGAGAENALENIKINTEKTVSILADMSLGETPAKTGTPTPTGTAPAQQTNSYVDPYTGLPSIQAAIGGIGGNFLAKVFDDETIAKYANKAKKKLFGETKEAEADTPKKTDQISGLITPEFKPKDIVKVAPAAPKQNDIASILGDLSLDLSSSKSVENERENDAQDEKQHREGTTLQEKTVEELKALHETTKANAEKSGGIFSTIVGLVGSIMPVLGMLGPAVAAVGGALGAAMPALASIAGGAAAVAGAGAAGYAVGSYAKDGIDSVITKATGREETLGTWLHGALSGDDEKVAEMLKTPAPVPKSTAGASINTVAKLEDKKAKDASAKVEQNNVTPVAINSTTNNNSSTNVIVGSSVRNHESTYERVQMSNIWGPI